MKGERPVLTTVVVAVPARNEVETIAACLRSIDIAAAAGRLPTTVVVAADCCEDATPEVARRTPLVHCELRVVTGQWAAAGAARAAAVTAGLDRAGGKDESVWIANTDGDTVATPNWLVEQLQLAQHSVAVAGVVQLDPTDTPAPLLERFRAAYHVDGPRHQHVHGANLGVRADAYLAAGGWCPHTTVGEDHGLWTRLVEGGHAVIQSTHVRVTTSARVTSRVEGGFASNLRALLADGFGDVA